MNDQLVFHLCRLLRCENFLSCVIAFNDLRDEFLQHFLFLQDVLRCASGNRVLAVREGRFKFRIYCFFASTWWFDVFFFRIDRRLFTNNQDRFIHVFNGELHLYYYFVRGDHHFFFHFFRGELHRALYISRYGTSTVLLVTMFRSNFNRCLRLILTLFILDN